MSDVLGDNIPTFGDSGAENQEVGLSNMSALADTGFASNWKEALILILVACGVIGGLELIVRIFDVPAYTFPAPSEIGRSLYHNFVPLYWPHLLVTLKVLLLGYFIGATIGIVLAAVITQFPFAEKIVTPYILLLVTTPMIALVPLLVQKLGFGIQPRVIAVALASGPMVMINAATGFRRTDLAKLALARSYGATTFQIFTKVRFPLALPMIIVGYMVGSIFGLLTAVGGEMVSASDQGGLGHQLVFFSSLIRMANVGAVILIIAVLGVSIYVVFFLIGKKWASWES
jgi:NitT/TauT family transport system permease protein